MLPLEITLLKFLAVGVTNTVVGMGVIYIAWHYWQLGDLVSNMLGYAVGIIWSYSLNRQWTFRDTGSISRSFSRFALVCGVAYVLNLIVVFATRHAMGPQSFLPHVFGNVIYTVTGYLGSRYFAFNSSQPVADNGLR